MIRHDLSEFLTATLDAPEVKIVRSSFGLDTGKSMSVSQTAVALGVPADEISKQLVGAIHKLRAAYASQYVDNPDSDDDDEFGGTLDSI